MLVLSGVYSWLPLDRETLYVMALMATAMILNGYSEIYLGVFRAFERMKLVASLMIIQRAVFFVIGFLWTLEMAFSFIGSGDFFGPTKGVCVQKFTRDNIFDSLHFISLHKDCRIP